MDKPILALDVDGPLNPWAASNSKVPKGYRSHRMSPRGWVGPPLKVRLNPAHGPMLLDFAATHGVELVWATTWEDQANTMIGPHIGLPALPVIEFGGRQALSRGWKYRAVGEYATGRPLVWLDDDFLEPSYARARMLFDEDRHAAGVPTLLMTIEPQIGLTSGDLTTVAEWLGAVL